MPTLSFNFLYSAEASYNFLPLISFFLIVSGNSLAPLNLRSISKFLKLRKIAKGGELAKSGSKLATISLTLAPNYLFKQAFNSTLAELSNTAAILSPDSSY